MHELVCKLSAPGIVGMLMTSVNAMVDAIFAGQFVGSAAMAGIALSIPLIAFNFAVVRWIGVGSASIVSRAIGAGSDEIIGTILYYTIALLLLFSLCISITGFLFADDLIGLMSGNGEVLIYGSKYYLMMSVFSLPSIFGVGTSVLIRAEGKMSYAMKITAVSVVLNILFCTICTVYFELGVTGLALSTILAMTIYSVLTLRYFILKKGILFFGKPPIRPDFKLLIEIVTVGFPGFLSQVSGLVRQIFLFKVMAINGAETGLVVFSAIYRTFSFSVTPVLGMVQALQPVAGINYGAQLFKRVRNSYFVFLKYEILLMTIIGIPLLVFSENILTLLIPDITLTQSDIFYFRLLISVMFLFPVFPNSTTFLQATGKIKQATLFTLFRDLLLFYPMIAYCWLWGKADSLYYGILIENVLCAFLLFMYMQLHLRKMKGNTDL